eukprot:GGOE01022070.1.p1 GENE.GGOE01022070.1~~GGOE01022070.1.p1  ORF type:complete len:206 (+),score=20.42 GGOE01022070.1:80-697(+)
MEPAAAWVAFVLGFAVLYGRTACNLCHCIAQRRAPRCADALAVTLILGGRLGRELAGLYCSCLEAWYRLEHPDLVADSTPSAAAQQATAGLHVDRTACDTLTNFTTMAALFSSRHCVHCAVVTDDHHMRRALWCGSVVLGAQGIFISEAVRIHSDDAVVSPGAKSESPWRAIRDLVRAVFWVLTSPVPGGPFTFEWVTHRVHPDR